MDAEHREELGKVVRKAWIEHCKKVGDTKPSHLAPWEELSEDDKEADRCIAEAIIKYVLTETVFRIREKKK